MSEPTRTRAEYEKVFETLGVTQPLSLDQTIELPPDTARTLRSSLPMIALGDEAEFRVRKILGQGGMGVVKLAYQAALGREVAIKTVRPEHATREQEDALLQEARAMGLIEHPNVVPVHSIGQDPNGTPVIVMKRIDGTPWLTSIEKEEGDLEFHLRVFMSVCQAISFAHQRGVIHRDIKPENIMVGAFGEVYLLDWGLAASLHEDTLLPIAKNAHAVVGTPVYMAPEMTVGDGNGLGIHTDVFLLGATLFHAITGTVPNQGKDLFQVMCASYTGKPRVYPPEIPTELRMICEAAMALDPKDRFESAEELRSAVATFLTHRSSHELVARSRQGVEKLHTLVATTDEDETDIYRVFGETRFALRTALEIWPENSDATKLLDECLRVMIGHALELGHTNSARQHYLELSQGDEELLKAIDEKAEQLKSEEVRLRKIAFDYDEDYGITSRRWFTVAMGVLFFGVSVGHILYNRMEDPPTYLVDDPDLFFANLVGWFFVPVMAMILYFVIRYQFHHKTSRVFAFGLLLMYTFGMMTRSSTIWADIPLIQAVVTEAMIYATGLLCLGMSIDRRLWGVGSAFLGAVVIILIVRDYPLEIFGIAAVLGCLNFLYFHEIWGKRQLPWHQ